MKYSTGHRNACFTTISTKKSLYEPHPTSYDIKLLSHNFMPYKYDYFQWSSFRRQDKYSKIKNILLPSHTACSLNLIMKQQRAYHIPVWIPQSTETTTTKKPQTPEVTLQCVQQQIFRCWWKEHIFLGHQISCAADNGQWYSFFCTPGTALFSQSKELRKFQPEIFC